MIVSDRARSVVPRWGRRIVLASLVVGRVSFAQDSTSCAERLRIAPPDSIDATFALSVEAFDVSRSLSAIQREVLLEGLRQSIRVPSPLTLPAFETDSIVTRGSTNGMRELMASATLSATYRVFWRGRHLLDVARVSGVSTPEFDQAVQQGVIALDTTALLPPLDSLTDSASLELRLAVSRVVPPHRISTRITRSAVEPVSFFRVRLPAWHVTRAITRRPDVQLARLLDGPVDRSRNHAATIEIVVDASGAIDPAAMTVLAYTSREMVAVVLPRLATWRFQPLEIAGCAVPSLERIEVVSEVFRAR